MSEEIEYIEFIDNGYLSTRAYNLLKRNGVHTVPDLQALTMDDILDWRGCGETTAQIIMGCLKAYEADKKVRNAE